MAPIKSSLAKTAKQLLGFRNTADLGLRGATQKSRKVTLPVSATGGTTYTVGDYKYHIYQQPQTGGTFNVSTGGAGVVQVEPPVAVIIIVGSTYLVL